LASTRKRSEPPRQSLRGLAEAAEGPRKTRFEDIVPKPYQEFKDVFAKESFDELPDWKNGTMLSNLSRNAQMSARSLPTGASQTEAVRRVP